MSDLTLIATTAFGLEAVVVRELQVLGISSEIRSGGRVVFSGDEATICKTNLWLRSAERVLLQVGRFEAKDFDVLFNSTSSLEWERWVPANGAVLVKGRSRKSQLASVPACQRSVKKAIVERLMKAHGVNSLPETGPKFTAEVAMLDDVATITLDTSGIGLHKRGYRKLVGLAPLRETLAAAMVQLSFWQPNRPLIDPFCGSGTIPIEAALIGRNIAPGLSRNFAAEAWTTIPLQLWRDAREEAKSQILESGTMQIIGTDHDEEALSQARYHAKVAGVADDIHFQKREFADLAGKREYGCVICNPPYGERVDDRLVLDDLYHSMPIVLRSLRTWSHFILTAYPEFQKLMGRDADRRRKLYNARIECTYFQYHGPKPGEILDSGETEKPAFGGLKNKAQAEAQATAFSNRVIKMSRHRRRWPKRGVSCYRVYNRDIPEVPLTLDVYEDKLYVAEFDRPHDRSPAEHADWRDFMIAAAAKVLEISKENVFVKHRVRQRGNDQYQRVAETGKFFEVSEGGLKFLVNLADYLDTGLFLDHRITRDMVRAESEGKRFLNLFAYTGSFSVYAAAGGAVSTTTVDLSNAYLDWARENMQLNNFAGSEHKLIRDDAMLFLKFLAPGERFDLAVVDPPTFSNSKRTEEDWDVQRDYAALLNRLRTKMSPGGVIYFSTNFRKFKLAADQLDNMEASEITNKTVPEDFANKTTHRCWRIVCP